MAVLRLYLEQGWPGDNPACDWALVDSGRVVRRGCSAPEHWPGGETVTALEAVLDPGQFSVHQVPLPARARQPFAQLAASALEDRLLEEPERCHFVAAGRQPAEETRIVVLPRARLATLVTTLGAIHGCGPTRLVAAGDLLPRAGDAWVLAGLPGGRWLLEGAAGSFAIDAVADLPGVLAALAPPRLAVCGPAPLPLAAEALPVFDWAESDWSAAPNLLTGEFRPAGAAAGLRAARRLAWAAGVAVAAYSLVTVAEWASLAHRQSSLKAEIRQLAARALPGEPLAAPLRQLLAAADRQRHRAGEAGRGDFAALAGLVGEALGPASLQEMNYGPGRIELRLAALEPSREEGLRQALARSGLELHVLRGAAGVQVTAGWWLAGERR